MTTRVIVKNADPDARPILVTTKDTAGAPPPATVSAGGEVELYIHDSRSLLVEELAVATSMPERISEHIEQFFAYAHLPPHLQAVSRPFAALAQRVVEDLPRNPERTVALRKLLEAKDAALRALVAKG